MGLFSSLVQVVADSAQGIRYVGEEKDEKLEDFSLHYRQLLKKIDDVDHAIAIIELFVRTAIGAAKSDGVFSKIEAAEITSFIEGSFGGELSSQECFELLKDINREQMDLVTLCEASIGASNRYGSIVIETLRAFLECIIYSDGQVHPKEVDFLNRWEKTISVLQK